MSIKPGRTETMENSVADVLQTLKSSGKNYRVFSGPHGGDNTYYISELRRCVRNHITLVTNCKNMNMGAVLGDERGVGEFVD